MSQPEAKRRFQFSLPMALAISVLLHLALLVFSFVVPLGLTVARALVPEDEPEIRFTFAQPTEEDLDGRIEGMIPQPTAPQPETEVPPTPREPTPEGPASLQPPSTFQPPIPPAPQIDPLPEPNRDEPEEEQRTEQAREEPLENVDEPPPQTLDDLPESARALLRNQPRPSPDEPSDGEESVNLDRAISEFVREVSRFRAAQPASAASQPRNVFVPDVSATPSVAMGVGNLVFESKDYDWSDYARQIYWAIWKAWHNRLYETVYEFEKWGQRNRQLLLEHMSQIRFVIERNGGVTGISVEGPSGCGPLDASAANALDEVILPPLPADFPRDREVVHARFIAHAEIMRMKTGLGQLKAAGYF